MPNSLEKAQILRAEFDQYNASLLKSQTEAVRHLHEILNIIGELWIGFSIQADAQGIRDEWIQVSINRMHEQVQTLDLNKDLSSEEERLFFSHETMIGGFVARIAELEAELLLLRPAAPENINENL